MSKTHTSTAKLVISAEDRASAVMKRMAVQMKSIAKIGAFNKMAADMKQVSKAAAPMARSISNASRSMAGFAGIAGGLGLAGIAGGISKVSSEMDRLAKTSRLIGTTGQQLRDLEYVGELQGVDASTITSSMQAFSKRLGEAKSGTGMLRSMLQKTNPVLLEQLTNAKDTAGAFEIYMSALRNAGGEAEQNAMAAAAFSRSGMKMALMAKLSGDEFKNMVAEGRGLRGVLSQSELKAAEDYNDSVAKLKSTFAGLGDVITKNLLPALTPMVEKFKDFMVINRDGLGEKIAKGLEKFAEALSKVNLDNVISGVESFFTGLSKLVENIGGVKNAMIALGAFVFAPQIAGVLTFGTQLAGLIVTIGKVTTKHAIMAGMMIADYAKVNGWMAANKMSPDNFIGPMNGKRSGLGKMVDALAFIPKKILRFAPKIAGAFRFLAGPIGVALAVVGGVVARYWEPISNFASGFFSEIKAELQPAIDFLSSIPDKIGNMITGAAIDIGAFFGFDASAVTAFIDSIKDGASKIWTEIKGIFTFSTKDYSDEKEAEFAESGKGFARALIDGIKSLFGYTTLGALINNWSNIGEAISGFSEKAVELGSAFVESLKEKVGQIFAWFSDLPSKIFEAIGGIDLTNLFNIDVTKILSKLKSGIANSWVGRQLGWSSGGGADGVKVDGARADGGPVAAGKRYLVGERGPELFLPKMSGNIIPNEVLSAFANYSGATSNDNMAMPPAIMRSREILNQAPQVMANSYARNQAQISGGASLDINFHNAPKDMVAKHKTHGLVFDKVNYNTGRMMGRG